MKWLKNKIQSWLGITENFREIKQLSELYADLTSIGIDVNFKEPHMILIFSKLNGGQIRHIECHFDNLMQLNKLAKELKQRYKPKHIYWDAPYNFRGFPFE